MQISYISPEGQLKHIDAQISPEVLTSLLDQYEQPQATRFKAIKFLNTQNTKVKTDYLVYSSAPTHNYVEQRRSTSQFTSEMNRIDLHFPSLYKGCRSKARFIKQLTQFVQNRYFAKSKYVPCLAFSEYEYQELHNLDALTVIELDNLIRFKETGTINIVYVPKADFAELQSKAEQTVTKSIRVYYAHGPKFPTVVAELRGGKYLTETEVEALAQFNTVDRTAVDFGQLPPQRCFKAQYANGAHGLLMVGGMDDKPLSSIKKLRPTHRDHALKKIEEINIVEFAKYQSGADFIESLA